MGRDENKQDKRARLREAAAALFVERGFDATTTHAVAERAVVGRRTVFRLFNDMESLYREMHLVMMLRIEDIPVPAVRDHEVLVKVIAVGVSYHDVVQRNGVMRRHTKLPIILGYEIAGRVFHELGAHVVNIGNQPDGYNINDHCGGRIDAG